MKKIPLFIFIALSLAGCSSAPKTTLSPVHEEAISRNRKGIESSNAGDLAKALAEFRNSLRLNRSMDDEKGIIISQLNISRTLLTMEEFDKAKKAVQEALARSKAIDDKNLIAESSATFSKYAHAVGEDRKALEYINRAIETDRKTGSKEIGGHLNILGLVLIRERRLKEAEEALNEALKNNLAMGNMAETANSHRTIGELMEMNDKGKEAEWSLEKALELDKKTGDSRKIAADLKRLGEISHKGNELKKAMIYFIRAYDVSLNSGNVKEAVNCLDRIISVAEEAGDSEKAAYYIEEKKRAARAGH